MSQRHRNQMLLSLNRGTPHPETRLSMWGIRDEHVLAISDEYELVPDDQYDCMSGFRSEKMGVHYFGNEIEVCGGESNSHAAMFIFLLRRARVQETSVPLAENPAQATDTQPEMTPEPEPIVSGGGGASDSSD